MTIGPPRLSLAKARLQGASLGRGLQDVPLLLTMLKGATQIETWSHRHNILTTKRTDSFKQRRSDERAYT